MARNPVRAVPPTSEPPVGVLRLELQDFARRLNREMAKKGWSQADLARHAFGSTKDTRGYNVARGRDRISVYVRGLQKPDQKHLSKIASALGVKPEDLAPGLFASAIDRERPAVMLQAVQGHSDKTHLIVNKLVPMSVAVKIVALLADDDEEL